ncbi:hypothetical protein [Microbulbifer epialgicus]|uniref:Beta-lactamase n=1 Tax=Microbulbifer epialgicus TaxID=393907 RepID=A0ABV4P7E1_9GAMM
MLHGGHSLLKKLLVYLTALTLYMLLPAHADSVDKLIKEIMDERQIPGLQLAVVKGGIIKQGNYDLSNL